MERKDALREAVVTSIERDILRVHRAFRIWYTMTVRLETHHQVDGLPMQRVFTPESNIEAQKIEEYISLEKDETPEIPTDPIRSESEQFDPMTFIIFNACRSNNSGIDDSTRFGVDCTGSKRGSDYF